MPPQPPEREEQGQVISKDRELEGFDDHRYVFTDISVGTDNKVSVVVHLLYYCWNTFVTFITDT